MATYSDGPGQQPRRPDGGRRASCDRGRSGDRHRPDRPKPASITALKREIRTKSGVELIDFILADIAELKRILFDPQSHQVFMSAMDATLVAQRAVADLAGREEPADTLTQSVPNNVTSEMGLALLHVADAIRPHPDVVAFLHDVDDDGFLDELRESGGRDGSTRRDPGLPRHVRHAVRRRDRHHEAALERTPHHARARAPRQHQELRTRRRPAALRAGAAGSPEKEHELLERVRALPDGERKAEERSG